MILVTGATGYIGGRLAARLLSLGHPVRAMARDPRRLGALAAAGANSVGADVQQPDSLAPALRGVAVAYYLIHSMDAGADFAARDRTAAQHFAAACAAAGVRRIVYLGGLGRGPALSDHLASRQEVGDVLRAGPVPVTELRAAIIVGAGSASFEIMRDLSRKLPVMICPRWVRSRCEPIALDQVLEYLNGVLAEPRTIGTVLEIGGGDVLTYADMLRQCAVAQGKRVRIIGVPVLTPRLSSYWLNLVTSVPMSIARPLVEGLRHDVVTTDRRIRDWIPVTPCRFSEAVERALAEDHSGRLASRWTGAVGRPLGVPRRASGAVLVDERVRSARASPPTLFAAVERIGGATGWYYADWLWRLRGLLDRLLGGVGMRRGRRDPATVVLGDPIDFWRVADYVPGRKLRLSAEMKLPGAATLEFEVRGAAEDPQCELRQRAEFRPDGLWGRAYWYALRPLHALVFRGMAAGIVRAAEASSTRSPLTAAVLLPLALFACAREPRAQPPSALGWVVTDTAYGPIRVGITLAEAQAAAGESFRTPQPVTGQGCEYAFSPRDRLAFLLEGGRIVRLEVRAPGVTTLEGAAVGDSEARINELYAGRITATPHKIPGSILRGVIFANAWRRTVVCVFPRTASTLSEMRRSPTGGASCSATNPTGCRNAFVRMHPDRVFRIPMTNAVRSLNLATAVGIVLYEAVHQLGSAQLGLLERPPDEPARTV